MAKEQSDSVLKAGNEAKAREPEGTTGKSGPKRRRDELQE
jgi:hypothetical protein